MNELYQKLESNGLIENDMIVLARYEGGAFQGVDKETFESMFGATGGDYNKLVEADQGRGYKQFFYDWKAKGVL